MTFKGPDVSWSPDDYGRFFMEIGKDVGILPEGVETFTHISQSTVQLRPDAHEALYELMGRVPEQIACRCPSCLSLLENPDDHAFVFFFVSEAGLHVAFGVATHEGHPSTGWATVLSIADSQWRPVATS